jgi:NAD kinase
MALGFLTAWALKTLINHYLTLLIEFREEEEERRELQVLIDHWRQMTDEERVVNAVGFMFRRDDEPIEE